MREVMMPGDGAAAGWALLLVLRDNVVELHKHMRMTWALLVRFIFPAPFSSRLPDGLTRHDHAIPSSAWPLAVIIRATCCFERAASSRPVGQVGLLHRRIPPSPSPGICFEVPSPELAPSAVESGDIKGLSIIRPRAKQKGWGFASPRAR